MKQDYKKYLEQDIDNPIYLFHGSPKKLSVLKPTQSHDVNNNKQNVANAIFLFPSFLKATPYAFKDTIKENSKELNWDFEIPNTNIYPLMIMKNVNINKNITGYIYVVLRDNNMIKDEDSYQYKCYNEVKIVDIIEIKYKDFERYYYLDNNKM